MVKGSLSENAAGGIEPPPGNNGGSTYTVGAKLSQSGGKGDIRKIYGGLAYTVRGKLSGADSGPSPLDDGEFFQHEAQTSPLAAEAGGILLDYLRCRLPDTPATWAFLREYLGALTERERGWRGWYDRSWAVLEGGIVAACSDSTRAAIEGVLVDLPGRACGSLGECLPLFLLLCTERGKITRADFAIDDRSGLLSRDRILAAEAAAGVVTRWRKAISEVHSLESGRSVGWTFYFGDRAGDSMIRIYDKASEQGVAGPWVRCELETKSKLADAICRAYFDRGGAAIIGQINRRLRFAFPAAADSNRWRWPALPWWAEFLESVQPGPSLLPGKKPELTIEGMRSYLVRQVAPTLATVLQHDDCYDLVIQLEAEGRKRQNSRHLAALEAAK